VEVIIAVAPTVKVKLSLPAPNLPPVSGTLQVKLVKLKLFPPELMVTVLFPGRAMVYDELFVPITVNEAAATALPSLRMMPPAELRAPA